MSRTIETEARRQTKANSTDNGSLSIRAEISASGTNNGHTLPTVFEDVELVERTGAQIQTVAGGSGGQDPTNATNVSSLDWRARVQFATVCWSVLLIGWNDGTPGPLLPRIQSYYQIGYAAVSLIFALSCAGFVLGAIANVYLVDKIGFGKAMVLGVQGMSGSIVQLVGYAVQSAAPPYPAFLIAFLVNGCGIALQDAGANGYVASLKDNSTTKMGLLHSIYGTGAFLSPLSATQFARLPHWSFQYLVSLGIAILNTVFLSAVFRLKRQEECLAEIGQAREEVETANHAENKFRQIFRIREVHYLATVLLLLVGVGTTIGGWSVTYIINVRGGGPNSGYVSSGFSGGVALGRVALLWVNKKIGERRAVFVYIILAIGLQLVVWLVPSLVGDAVAVSLVGVVLGPLYPIVINHAGRILPHWLLTGSVGWMAGFAQAGSAFLPLVTGAIASKAGIEALQPLLIALMLAIIVLWATVPSTARRLD